MLEPLKIVLLYGLELIGLGLFSLLLWVVLTGLLSLSRALAERQFGALFLWIWFGAAAVWMCREVLSWDNPRPLIVVVITSFVFWYAGGRRVVDAFLTRQKEKERA